MSNLREKQKTPAQNPIPIGAELCDRSPETHRSLVVQRTVRSCILTFACWFWWALGTVNMPASLLAEATELRSHQDRSLDYPVTVVDPNPFLRPGTAMGQEGNFKVENRSLGTVPAERMRLPVPGSTWRLDGRVGRTKDGIIYAGFGTYLYRSEDDGKNWNGVLIEGLPDTRPGRVAAIAFGASGKHILLAHRASALAPTGRYENKNPAESREDLNIYPLVISRSANGGRTWERSAVLPVPPGFRGLAGDGNSIVELGDGSLLAALDGIAEAAQGAEVFLRSRDQGQTWKNVSLMSEAAETGLMSLGGLRVLAAIRGIPNARLGGKTIELANSEDGGHTWSTRRPLTRTFGQAHGDLAQLPGVGVVAVYENRYPYRDEGEVQARISWDNGITWTSELYILSKGHGYGGSVASNDGVTVITVLGDGELDSRGSPTGRGYTLQAVRWKPWRPPGSRTLPESR